MTDAPERIWAKTHYSNWSTGYWHDGPIVPNSPEHIGTEYRRADIPRPEDAARIAELEAALATLRDWHQSNQAKLQAAYAIANRLSWDKKTRALSEEIHAALKGGDA